MTSRGTKEMCDICTTRDGWRGHTAQKCILCGVVVHETCYGLYITGQRKPSFECHACAAIGQTFEGRTRHGVLKQIAQKRRSQECALCSVSDGIHAMHPLYDAPGEDGRQVILAADDARNLPERLAWVHSLCAQGVCSHPRTTGCVYGCDEDGDFEVGDDDDEESIPKAKKRKSGKKSKEKDAKSDVVTLHHFVMCGLDGDTTSPWAKLIAELRKEVKCIVCGRSDHSKKSLRIPLQCCAGDEEEHDDFKDRHRNLEHPCVQALHVGCAMWGTNDVGEVPPYRRMFFYPGVTSDDNKAGFTDPVANIFCDLHARDLFVGSDGKQVSRRASGTATALPRRITHAEEHTLLRRTMDSTTPDPVPIVPIQASATATAAKYAASRVPRRLGGTFPDEAPLEHSDTLPGHSESGSPSLSSFPLETSRTRLLKRKRNDASKEKSRSARDALGRKLHGDASKIRDPLGQPSLGKQFTAESSEAPRISSMQGVAPRAIIHSSPKYKRIISGKSVASALLHSHQRSQNSIQTLVPVRRSSKTLVPNFSAQSSDSPPDADALHEHDNMVPGDEPELLHDTATQEPAGDSNVEGPPNKEAPVFVFGDWDTYEVSRKI